MARKSLEDLKAARARDSAVEAAFAAAKLAFDTTISIDLKSKAGD